MIPFLGPADPFPLVESALTEPDGLLAAGGTLSARRLTDAYRRGIFPWFNEGDPILWWSPDPRTVLRPSQVHVSHSLRKRLKKRAFAVTVDAAFEQVLDGCAGPRAGEAGTWLSPAMRRAYTTLHRSGLGHSVEVWMDGELAGGLYGVALGRMFFGESMFTRRTDASKIAIVQLCAQLVRWDMPLIDCQLETDHLVSLGAECLPRPRFIAELERLVAASAPSWTLDADLAGDPDHAPRRLPAS